MGYCLGIDSALLILLEPLLPRFSLNRPISCAHRQGTSKSGLLDFVSYQMLTKPSVQPRLFDPTHSYIYVTQKDLLSSLKTTVLGFSSKFYVWEATSEQFIQIETEQNFKKGFMLIDGKDEVVSERYVSTLFLVVPKLTSISASAFCRDS